MQPDFSLHIKNRVYGRDLNLRWSLRLAMEFSNTSLQRSMRHISNQDVHPALFLIWAACEGLARRGSTTKSSFCTDDNRAAHADSPAEKDVIVQPLFSQNASSSRMQENSFKSSPTMLLLRSFLSFKHFFRVFRKVVPMFKRLEAARSWIRATIQVAKNCAKNHRGLRHGYANVIISWRASHWNSPSSRIWRN